MRIIAGIAKGRKLITLPGDDTRPTTDRVKESVFNIVQFDIEGRDVLDLFSGSGQMGIESLSRGAASATFLDMSPKATEVIRKNLSATGFSDRARVVTGDALGFIGSQKEKFDLIFLDPPYGTRLFAKTLAAIMSFDICREGGIILGECGADTALPEAAEKYAPGRTYTYGRTLVSLYHRRSVDEKSDLSRKL